MSDLTIFDTSGEAYSAVLADGVPEIRVNNYNFPVFLFQIKIRDEHNAIHWLLEGKFHRQDGPASEYPDGRKFWYVNNRHHRQGGPAVEFADGRKHWYVDNKLHRLDGPASEYPDGRKYWYVGGKRHRLDGPAVELASGEKHWFIEDEYLTEEEFNERVSKV